MPDEATPSGARGALAFTVALGLALPLLPAALAWLGLGARTLVGRLLVYELALAALGLAVALAVASRVRGSTPGPFSRGTLDVAVRPVRWLGLGTSSGVTWRRELLPMTLFVTIVTALFTYLATHTSFAPRVALERAPWIVLFAALNAAGEEWIYRVALLRASDGVLRAGAAAWLSALVFGLAHLGGIPGGLTGALAAGLLGFLLSRVTLETRGIASALAVHFVQDLVIFTGLLGASGGSSPSP